MISIILSFSSLSVSRLYTNARTKKSREPIDMYFVLVSLAFFFFFCVC